MSAPIPSSHASQTALSNPQTQALPGNGAPLYREGPFAVTDGCGLTRAQVARLALRILGVSSIGTGAGVGYLACFGWIAFPYALLVVPFGLFSAGVFWLSNRYNDEEHPVELERLRSHASRMDLTSVIQTFGWRDILQLGILTPELFAHKYNQEIEKKSLLATIDYYEKTLRSISQYPFAKYHFQVPTPRHSAGKWRGETSSMGFQEIIQTYPLDRLQQYSLIEAGELKYLKSLKSEYDAMKAQRDSKARAIEREFEQTTVEPKRLYDEECRSIERGYAEDPAVKELQGIELCYTKERQQVQDQQAKAKKAARDAFDLAVGRLTNNGKVAYHRLPMEDKTRYDVLRRQLQTAEAQADFTAREQIEQINARRQQRLVYLNGQKEHSSNDRKWFLGEARGRYEASVAVHQRKRIEKLKEIDDALSFSDGVITSRYRAYLRTIGARR